MVDKSDKVAYEAWIDTIHRKAYRLAVIEAAKSYDAKALAQRTVRERRK